MTWERIPKNVIAGAQTLRIGVYEAILSFNHGAIARNKVLSKMGIVAEVTARKLSVSQTTCA